MTAAENAPEPPWEPSEAYPELARLASAMRPDWSRQELWDSITAAQTAGRSWKDIYREVMRLAWDGDETPATLRNSARRPAAGAATGPEVNARGLALTLAAIEEVRKTGPQQRLAEGSDPRRGAGDSTRGSDRDGL